MKLTIIISYYKNLNNLKLILKALNNQSVNNFEAIISEDDNNDETIDFVKNNQSNSILRNKWGELGWEVSVLLLPSIRFRRSRSPTEGRYGYVGPECLC